MNMMRLGASFSTRAHIMKRREHGEQRKYRQATLRALGATLLLHKYRRMRLTYTFRQRIHAWQWRGRHLLSQWLSQWFDHDQQNQSPAGGWACPLLDSTSWLHHAL